MIPTHLPLQNIVLSMLLEVGKSELKLRTPNWANICKSVQNFVFIHVHLVGELLI